MKKLIVLIVIAITLLFSGCNPFAPDYPVIVLFEANPEVLECGWIMGKPVPPGCWPKSTISWEVIGADIVNIIPDIGYVGAAGNEQVCCWDLFVGPNTFTLTAKNSAGSINAYLTITRIPQGLPIL